MTGEKIVSVSTTCPFCGGSAALLHEQGVNPTTSEIAARFAGRQLTCAHPGCERTFRVRRADLRIQRREVRRP